MGIVKWARRATLSTEDRALRKAGVVNDCDELTSDGQDLLMFLLYKDKKADMAKIAAERSAELAKAKKAK